MLDLIQHSLSETQRVICTGKLLFYRFKVRVMRIWRRAGDKMNEELSYSTSGRHQRQTCRIDS